MSKHTPTPWELTPHGRGWLIDTRGAYRYGPIAIIGDDSEGIDSEMRNYNAAFIVRAVNAHEDLVEALNYMLNAINILGGDCPQLFVIPEQVARAALATARGAGSEDE